MIAHIGLLFVISEFLILSVELHLIAMGRPLISESLRSEGCCVNWLGRIVPSGSAELGNSCNTPVHLDNFLGFIA